MKYIINADDFGRTTNTNRAIIEGFKLGYLDRASIMVNTPGFDEAVRGAYSAQIVDKIGLHFNIITGEPLSDEIKSCRSFCGTDGRFNGKIFQSKRLRIFLLPEEVKAIKNELVAQINKYIASGFTLRHLDSHGHTHTFPSIMPICLWALRKSGLKSIRLSLNYSSSGIKDIFKKMENYCLNRVNIKSGRMCRYFDSMQVACNSFETTKMQPGVFEIMVHPDYRDGVHRQIEDGYDYEYLHFFDKYRIES